MDVQLIWTDLDEAGDYIVPKGLRDLVSRPDNMDENALHTIGTFVNILVIWYLGCSVPSLIVILYLQNSFSLTVFVPSSNGECHSYPIRFVQV